MKEIEVEIENLMRTLRSVRANIYELTERDKAISNQIMILENVKMQIKSQNTNEDSQQND